jgi:hypothetical protein
MLGLQYTRRSASSGLFLVAALQLPVVAQEAPVAAPDVPLGGVAGVASAVEKWLQSDQVSEKLESKTVAAVLQQRTVGLQWLGQKLEAALKAPDTQRSKGLRSLSTKVTLEFLRQAQESGMVFVGQYDPLSALQPLANDLLFGLLLETPDWYPFTFRDRLVAPLRDLQLKLPGAARVDGIVAMIKNQQEPTDLRNALAAMMAQWGRTEYADAVVKQLTAATTEGDGEDRVQATLQLADYYNVLRDYKRSAQAHRTAQALAKGAGVRLLPIAWYAAACVHALNGNVERGMEALQTCASMLASPDLDRSLRLERKLFEQDPEISLLRKDERFAAVLRLAFGEAPAAESGKDGR